VQYAISAMGLPVLLSVLAEDRDDLELLKGALEVLQLSVALPDGAAAAAQQESPEVGCTCAPWRGLCAQAWGMHPR
jgi:hypothetical protein